MAGVTRYRWTIAPTRTRHGPWRETRDEAVQDAIAAGLASRDEHVPEKVFLDELVEVERE